MLNTSRRATATLAVGAAAVIGGAAVPAAATTPAVTDQRAPSIEVLGTPGGIFAPGSRAPGLTVFQVRSTDPEGTRLGLIRLRDGVRLDTFMTHLQVALTQRGPAGVEAGRQVAAEASLLGGALAVPGRTASFTEWLSEGTYHLVDYRSVEAGRLGAHPLVVGGATRHDRPSLPQATITMVDTADGPRFRAPSELPAGATLLVWNRTNQLDEAVFVPVKPEATSADVQRFFEAYDRGEYPTYIPFTGEPPQGMPVISAGRAQLVQPGLASGRYALTSWVSGEDGHLLAAKGMHALVQVASVS